jgi:hypothetical protein
LISSIGSAAQIKLAWDPNTEADLVGYKVYYGTASRTYGPPIDVGNVTIYTVPALMQGVTYYFALTAYDSYDNESGYSNEVYGMVTPTVPEIVRVPNVLSGPTTGVVGSSYTYTTGGSVSSLGDTAEYQFDWKGGGTSLSAWGSATQSNAWTSPGTYNVRVRARCAIHTSVISSWVGPVSVAISQTTAAIEVPFNVIPKELNVKQKGVLPVVVHSSGDVDVTTVNPESLLLEGVVPLRWDMGRSNLILKFSARDIVAAIGEVNDGEVVVLQLTGNLNEDAGGDAIIGEDTVIILKKGKL